MPKSFFLLLSIIAFFSYTKAEEAKLQIADSALVKLSIACIPAKDKTDSSQTFSLTSQSTASYPALTKKQQIKPENRKLTAALLTLTLGMLGVHRLYLGTKPWVPIVYLVTFGGVFFILPFIDFVVILLSEDIGKFENNGKILMWAN